MQQKRDLLLLNKGGKKLKKLSGRVLPNVSSQGGGGGSQIEIIGDLDD